MTHHRWGGGGYVGGGIGGGGIGGGGVGGGGIWYRGIIQMQDIYCVKVSSQSRKSRHIVFISYYRFHTFSVSYM